MKKVYREKVEKKLVEKNLKDKDKELANQYKGLLQKALGQQKTFCEETDHFSVVE